MRANLLHDLENVGAVENGPPLLPELPDQVLKNQRVSYVKARQRFIENQKLRVIYEGRNEQDALSHSLRVRRDRSVPMRVERKQIEKRIDLPLQFHRRHPSQASNELQILTPAQVWIEIGFLGYITEMSAEANEIPSDASPLNKTLPRVGSNNPVNIFTVVLFPDPFGPKQPITCPGVRQKETAVTAGTEEYVLVNSLASSIGIPGCEPPPFRERHRRQQKCSLRTRVGHNCSDKETADRFFVVSFGLAKMRVS
jgi:hypothetical protein